MARATFINPVNPAGAGTYEWHRGYETDDEAGKTRQITGTANTGNVGRVRQQGDSGPFVRTLHGKISHSDQHQKFWAWYRLCDTQTIHFLDFDGQVYEVQITALTMKKVPRLPNSAPDPTMSHHYYEWTMTLEVYGFVSGAMHDAGVAP